MKHIFGNVILCSFLLFAICLAISACFTAKMIQRNINAANTMFKATNTLYKDILTLEETDITECGDNFACIANYTNMYQSSLNAVAAFEGAMKAWQSGVIEYQADKSHITISEISQMAGDALIAFEDIAKAASIIGLKIPTPDGLDNLCVIVDLYTAKQVGMCNVSLAPIIDAGIDTGSE